MPLSTNCNRKSRRLQRQLHTHSTNTHTHTPRIQHNCNTSLATNLGVPHYPKALHARGTRATNTRCINMARVSPPSTCGPRPTATFRTSVLMQHGLRNVFVEVVVDVHRCVSVACVSLWCCRKYCSTHIAKPLVVVQKHEQPLWQHTLRNFATHNSTSTCSRPLWY